MVPLSQHLQKYCKTDGEYLQLYEQLLLVALEEFAHLQYDQYMWINSNSISLPIKSLVLRTQHIFKPL